MTEEAINILKNQLVGLEGGLKTLTDDISRENAGPRSRAELKARLSVLDSHYERTCEVLSKLEGYSHPLPERRTAVMTAYMGARVTLYEAIEALEPEPRPNAPILEQTLQQAPVRGDHLPRIELPTFNGSPTEWLAFKGRFEKRIANITEDADKYAFLAKCLENFAPARNSAEAAENAGTSFAEVWVKLGNRFYKKRIAFEGYFHKLLQFKKINRPNSKAILSLIDLVDTTVHSAKQILGDNEPEVDCVASGLIVGWVKSRLDAETASKLEDRMDIHTVYTWIQYREELEKRANQLACQPEPEEKPKNSKTVATVTATKTKEVKSKQGKQQQPCFVCNEKGHAIWYCVPFKSMTISERWEKARQSRRCFNCLAWGHAVQKCTSDRKCLECGKPHHTMLHFEAIAPEEKPAANVAAQASTSKDH